MTRIVAGSAGGRTLAVPPRGTRPTSERVREALFSRLEHVVGLDGARVLDLYAGSGALGLEAASRRGMRTVERTVGRADDGVLIASGMLVLGLLWLVVTGGAVPAGIFWPLVIGGVGVVTIWVQVDERVTPDRNRKAGPWQRFTRGGGAMRFESRHAAWSAQSHPRLPPRFGFFAETC